MEVLEEALCPAAVAVARSRSASALGQGQGQGAKEILIIYDGEPKLH